ncbi:MAG TPA: hypothetical protein DDY91_07650 [Planctomycetaceae bacterium]|jgi:hypothetical protein|nr:hypothetical protein [Planctomycetaceae bacterium]
MASRYKKHGISFAYPERWDLAENLEPDQVTISLSSPGTSFLTICLFQDRPDPAEVAEATLEAFRDEYTELDIYPVKAKVGRRPAVAWDLEFFCLELTNSARIRAFRAPRFTCLVLFQGTDQEFEKTEETFRKIARSIRCRGTAHDLPESDETDSDDEEEDIAGDVADDTDD